MTSIESIPRLEFGCYPTPVEEMLRLRAALGPKAPRLYIKHDEYAGPGFGGNKVRKLEYVLARAVGEGADCVLTMGGIRSNHCRVTAALAARVGLECHLILNGAPAAETPANFYLDELYGAKIHLVASREERALTQRRMAEELRAAGQRPFEVPLGASNAVGSLGYVRGALELSRQNVAVDWIYVSSSSGGTQAGLDVGLQLFGLEKVRLVGVSPDDSSAAIAREVEGIRDGIEELLGVKRGSLARPLAVDDRYVGPGYGIPTPESEEAIRLVARTEGILLDPVYTGKAMAALIAAIREGRISDREPVLFWHTGGQMALFSADSRRTP